jgi:xanthine dehydrogenase molybdenum-binding subunit
MPDDRARVPRRDAAAKAAGTFPFLGDRPIAGCLWAAVVRSPHPHAELLSLDTAALAAMPGVVAVFGAGDVPARRFNPAAVPADPELGPTADKRLLTRTARHVGDGVAVVVADSREHARRAARAPVARWRPLPALLGIDAALAAGAVLGSLSAGDRRVPALLARADLVVEDRYELAAAQHTCLEPHCCAAVPEPGGGRIELWTNTQAPAEVRRLVASILGLPEARIRVRKADEGGGFGAKQDLYEEALVVWLARRLGRAVRLAYTRAEELTAGRVRHGGRIEVRLGFDRAGRLLAGDLTALLDAGAYASHSPYVLSCVAGHQLAAYPRAAHRFRGAALRTNTIPGGAYRGYGVAQACFAIEQAMDAAAGRLGIDPLELRRRNAATGADGRGLAACIERLRDARPGPRRGAGGRLDGRLRGTGVAVAVKHSVTSAEQPDAGLASVRLLPGPGVALATGTCDSGTGSSTALAQLVADELGCPVDAVAVEEGDSDRGPVDLGSTAQRSVFVGGHAAREAAARARAALLDHAARVGGVPAGDLALRWPLVVDRRSGEPVAALDDLVRHGADEPRGEARVAAPGNGASYCALRVRVAVDPDTGQVAVEDAVMAVDCGTVVNRLGAEGQVTGGIVQGIGIALADRWVPGDGGGGPAGIVEHGVPRSTDAPRVEALFERARPGAPAPPAAGLGELPIIPVAAAVANAVAAATGVRCRTLPLRPATVWAHLAPVAAPEPALALAEAGP